MRLLPAWLSTMISLAWVSSQGEKSFSAHQNADGYSNPGIGLHIRYAVRLTLKNAVRHGG